MGYARGIAIVKFSVLVLQSGKLLNLKPVVQHNSQGVIYFIYIL